MQFIESYINSLMLWTVAIIVGRMLLESKEKTNIVTTILIILISSGLLSVLNMAALEILNGTVKILLVYALQCIFYKLTFRQTISKSLVVALIWYLSLVASEVLIAIVVSIITYYNHSSMIFVKNNIILNILIASGILLIIKIFKAKLINILKNDSNMKNGTFIVIFTILITIALLVFRVSYKEWKFSVDFIITMLIVLGFSIVGFTILRQRAQIQETTSKYQQLANYSDVTNDLLEEYRIVAHEHKNQLSAIKNMLEDNAPDISDYIDTLLEKRGKLKYYWIEQLNHLPLSGLKGLINYKLMEIESKKLDVNINVSKEVTKTNLPKLTIKQKDSLYSIMGVYLDNAIQAAEVSKKKEISLEIFKENKDVVIIIANTYNGKIDLEKIDEYGYSTKGKNHGVGLHIVKKILEEESVFSQNRNILEDYYVQELRIHLEEIKK